MNRIDHGVPVQANPTSSEPSTELEGTVDAPSATVGLHLERPAVIRYVTAVVALGIPLLTIPIFAGLPVELFLLVLVYVVYLGGAIVLARRSGPDGVRRLFAGVLRWRIGWANWAVVAGALPIATVAVALTTGTLSTHADGWPTMVGNYLFFTFIFGALVVNIFEEAAWQGLVQRNLTRKHGPLRAAMLTAMPFAAVHIPLSFAGDATMSEALGATALLFIFAPAMRYLMGRTDIATGGSLLAVGVMHASFNASGQLEVTGAWQPIAGLVLTACLVFAADRRRAGSKLAAGTGVA